MASKSLADLARLDLARSGLTLEDAEQLGIQFLTAEEVVKLGHREARCGMAFAYYDPFQQDFMPVTQFHRVRFLEAPEGLAAQTKYKRYSQPAGTLNSVYVPRVVSGEPFDWITHLKGRDDLFITEGEKKAAAACKRGIPTLGLGGVDLFLARKRGAQALPIIDDIDFRGRTVYVVFDTDSEEGLKDSVMRAAARLMDFLLLRGAIPKLAVLPARENGDKQGLDDYLLSNTAEDFRTKVLPLATDHASSKLLCRLADEYSYVTEIDRFVGEDRTVFMRKDHFDNATGHLGKFVLPKLERIKVAGGGFEFKMVPSVVSPSEGLLCWGGTEKFMGMVYEPGKPREIYFNGQRFMNMWEGWRCELDFPELPGKVVMHDFMGEWNWALDNVFGEDPVAREFIEHWLYYPLKYPGTKLNTFVLVMSEVQGIGKSFIGEMVARFIYGLTKPGVHHAWLLSEGDLNGQFNPYMYANSLVIGDDIAAHDKRSVYAKLKSFVTATSVQINLKSIPQFSIDNRANFYLTSNDTVPFIIDNPDRRAFVHQPRKSRKDTDRYQNLKTAFEMGIGGRTLLEFAREKYDEKDFNPKHPAPLTGGRSELISNSVTGLRDWVRGLIEGYAELSRSFATANEIYALAELTAKYLMPLKSPDAIGQALRDQGAKRWNGGKQVGYATSSGRDRQRIWMLGNFDKVESMSHREIAETLQRVPFGYKEETVVPMKKRASVDKKY